jgi:hypothetical protein
VYFSGMSVAEILNELPRLSATDRDLLFQRLSEMGAGEIDETPELLAAIDEAEAAPEADDSSPDQLRQKVTRWARGE